MQTWKSVGCAAGVGAVLWLGVGAAEAGAKSKGVSCLPTDAAMLDPDGDGDGLSDFQETHKYFTDPARADSDGDGVPDGEWNERREYAYTLRTITQVLKPVTPDVMQDDYQDARVLDDGGTYVELEVVTYPLNTVASAIVADPNWRTRAAVMTEWTKPGPTANWDDAMREKIIAGLKADGIDALALSDKELVEKAAPWLLKHAKYQDGFSTFCSTFTDGKVGIYPGLEGVAKREAAKGKLTVEEQWERELFAKGMFERGLRGSCTSSAIYMNGCLRALGVPTRIVLCVPLIDGTDSSEPPMLERIANHSVRATVQEGTANLGQGWSSHTYNEVFVGGRWRRLNYDRLGQNILDPHYFGLMIHVATFGDWADGNMAATWGVRELNENRPPDVFGGANPYSTLSVSDRFGVHGSHANPAPSPTASEFTELTIDQAVWYAQRPAGLEMSTMEDDSNGHVFVHVVEGSPGKGGRGGRQYDSFYKAVDKRFVLRAQGKADVPINAERGFWVDDDPAMCHFYLRIAPEAFAAMAPGVPYTLAVSPEVKADGACRWKVSAGVTLTRPEAGAEVAATPPQPGTPETITIKGAFWSDTDRSLANRLAGMGPVILVDVGHDRDFPAFKRFCQAADLNFMLEAAGHPTLVARAAVGGITIGEESHGLIVLEGESWDKLVYGVEYTIKPVNSVGAHRWVVAEGVRCKRR